MNAKRRLRDDDQVPSQKKNGEDRIPPNNIEDKRNPLLNKKGEDRIPPNQKQTGNQKLPKEPIVSPYFEKRITKLTLLLD